MSSLRWKKFFVESGLPSEVCENYAVIFSENRIRFDMLEELSKEILHDMGIKKMGDIISILRHAKEVHSSSYREKVFATDEGNESAKQESNNSTYIKADSTISNERLKKNTNSGETRRIILSPRSELTKGFAPPIKTGPPMRVVRRAAEPAAEPIVIRPTVSGNITGIRNVTGLDPVDPPIVVNRKRVNGPGNELEGPRKAVKTDVNVNPVVRNRIEAQNRLSNFSKEIQKVITSNSSSKPLLSHTTQSAGAARVQQQQVSVKSRLTLDHADSTTITINRNATARRNIDVKSRLGNHPSASTSSTSSSSVSSAGVSKVKGKVIHS